MIAVDKLRKVQLVKGEFSPSEAWDVINGLLDEKINFHKIQRLKIYEGNEQAETLDADERIRELMEEKKHARRVVREARERGCTLEISGTINFKLKDCH